jgi:SAM-dependent methyltransferase
MFSFIPSLDSRVAAENLATILAPQINPLIFQDAISRLGDMFSAYVTACPPPWFAPGLVVNPEIRYQSELWLPLSRLKPVFESFYRAALTCSPILSSSPFYNAVSWADVVAGLPHFCDSSADPSDLLERLLSDAELRTQFLCWSFMPRRFYGNGSDRYAAQTDYVREWLGQRNHTAGDFRCLDAACGDGAATYGLAMLIRQLGRRPGRYAVEGWSLDPLEVWAAAHTSFPHDPSRQHDFRASVAGLFKAGAQQGMVFRAIDLEDMHTCNAAPAGRAGFDLIICNGLLGGPVINSPFRLRNIVCNLSALLAPGGLLLAADHFHGGWKKNVPGEALGELFRACGLRVIAAGEGLGGVRGR